MPDLDGSILEDLFWENCIDFQHYFDGPASWIEAYVGTATVVISETYPAENSWTLSPDTLEIGKLHDGDFVYAELPDIDSEDDLIRYLLELSA